MDFEQIKQSATDYFAANPNMIGLLVAALGLLLFIGTLLQWEWVLSANTKFSLLRAIFGARGQMFIYSTVITLGGIALFLFL